MAVGVPETDVFAAADAVLARGERPTVERVRLELGRGSPARVGGLLDLWWARLTERLNGETRLPTLPGEVSQAFVAVWQQAVHLAQGVAEQGLSEQRQILTIERERVAEIEDQARRESATHRQQITEAIAARQAVEVRLADLELLLEQRRLQVEDLQIQRDALMSERNDVLELSKRLQEQLKTAQLKAEQERSAQDVYTRGVEDRAHREVDRAREEKKASDSQLKATTRQAEQLQKKLEGMQSRLQHSEQRAVAERARGDTLALQLTQLREFPLAKRKPRSPKKTRPEGTSKLE